MIRESHKCLFCCVSLICLLTACSTPQPVENTPAPKPVITSAIPSMTPALWTLTASPSPSSTQPPPVHSTAERTIIPSSSPLSKPTPITASEPVDLSDWQFDDVVINSPVPVMVDFWAPWCGPCIEIKPFLDKLALDYRGRLLIVRIDTDQNPQVATDYGVLGIPTLLFFQDGGLIHRQIGYLPEEMLRELIIQFLEVNSTQPAPD